MLMAMKMASKCKCELHFDFLCRSKQLPALKNHVKLMITQKTKIKHSNVTTLKLLRWHGTVDSLLKELGRLNSPFKEWEAVKNDAKLYDLFVDNVDAAWFMANEGNVKVVGSAEVKKHEKNTDDNHDSITIIRCGVSSNHEGPRFFLVKAKSVEYNSMKNICQMI